MSAAARFSAIDCERRRDELVHLAKVFGNGDIVLAPYAAELRAMVGRLEDDIEKARAEERNREPQPQNVNGSIWWDDIPLAKPAPLDSDGFF